MIAVAFLLLGTGYLLLYSGFTGTSPIEELKSTFSSGRHASGTQQGAGGGGNPPGAPNPPQSPATGLRTLPLRYVTRSGIQVAAKHYDQIIAVCQSFNLKVSAGVSQSHSTCSDHRCGYGTDFDGSQANLRACNLWAKRQGFAWVGGPATGEAGHDGHTHISFSRCPDHAECLRRN